MKCLCSLGFLFCSDSALIRTHPYPHSTLRLVLQFKFAFSLLAKLINAISLLLDKSETCLE